MKGKWWHASLLVWIERCILSALFPAVVFPHFSHSLLHCSCQQSSNSNTEYSLLSDNAHRSQTATADTSTCTLTACAHTQLYLLHDPGMTPHSIIWWTFIFLNNNVIKQYCMSKFMSDYFKTSPFKQLWEDIQYKYIHTH